MVDLTFDPRSGTTQGTITDGTTSEPIIDHGVAAGLFDAFPITAIQGIGRVWQKKLNSTGISTIGALATLDRKALLTLCRDTKSHRPVEFQAKAKLSQSELPLAEEFKLIMLYLYVTTGTFIPAPKGLNIESPGQRPGIIMVINI
jgi:hypothetical protein